MSRTSPTSNWPRSARTLDFYNVQGYDFHGTWETDTNHASPLFDDRQDPVRSENFNIDYTINSYLRAGVPARKLVLGIPLYGRGWTGVPNVNHGLYQTSTGPAPFDPADFLQTPGVETYLTLSTATGAGYTELSWIDAASPFRSTTNPAKPSGRTTTRSPFNSRPSTWMVQDSAGPSSGPSKTTISTRPSSKRWPQAWPVAANDHGQTGGQKAVLPIPLPTLPCRQLGYTSRRPQYAALKFNFKGRLINSSAACSPRPCACSFLLPPKTRPRPCGSPQILGVAHIGLRTDDLDAARKFYGGVLGFQEPFTARHAERRQLAPYLLQGK